MSKCNTCRYTVDTAHMCLIHDRLYNSGASKLKAVLAGMPCDDYVFSHSTVANAMDNQPQTTPEQHKMDLNEHLWTRFQRICIPIAWSFNMLAFITVLWGGEYCIIELGMKWIINPRICTLLSLGVIKVVLSVLGVLVFLNKDSSNM